MPILAHSEFPFLPLFAIVGAFSFALVIWSGWWAVKCAQHPHTKWLVFPLILLMLAATSPLVGIAYLLSFDL